MSSSIPSDCYRSLAGLKSRVLVTVVVFCEYKLDTDVFFSTSKVSTESSMKVLSEKTNLALVLLHDVLVFSTSLSTLVLQRHSFSTH